MKNVIQFHIDNNYYIRIKSTPKTNGCLAYFPVDLIRNRPELVRTYLIIDDNKIEIYNQENNEIKSKIINTYKINIRLLILEDILLRTLERGISRNLILIEDKKTIFDLLNIPMTKDELNLEKELCLCFRDLLIGKVKNDMKEEIVNSYQQIVECFENGGL